jgi:hypothetical protein
VVEASTITLLDLFQPVDQFSRFATLMYPTALQQTFTSTRPASPDSYRQDLGEFLAIYKERTAWLKSQKYPTIWEFCAAPASNTPSQFLFVTAFQHAANAALYRHQFNP